MSTTKNNDAMLKPEDITFLALLVAPDIQPFMVKPETERRLREANLVTWLHGTLIPTPEGVQFVSNLAGTQCDRPSADQATGSPAQH